MVFMLTGLAHDNAALLIETPATHFVTTRDSGGVFTRSFLTPDTVTRLQAVAGAEATPLAQSFATLSRGDQQLSGVLMGVQPGSFMNPAAQQGQPLSAGSTGAVVDESLREDGVTLGDTLTLKPGGETLRVIGFTRAARLNHQPVVFVTLRHWQTLNPRLNGTVNTVALNTEGAAARAAQLAGVTVHTRAAVLQELPGYREEQGSLIMIQVFLIVVAAFVLAVFFYVLTLQKTPQFGLLKAIGASTRTLAGSLVAQMMVLSVLAVTAAALVTLGAAALLPAGLPFTLTVPTVLGASALLIAVAALSSLLSLGSIARVDPLIAIGAST